MDDQLENQGNARTPKWRHKQSDRMTGRKKTKMSNVTDGHTAELYIDYLLRGIFLQDVTPFY